MKLLIATANTHKVEEISHLLGSSFELISLRDFPRIEMPDETGATMADNARLKAVHCARESSLPALADDSGIEVDALGGAPGVRSARWVPGSDSDRTCALLAALEDVADQERSARYRCAICLAFTDGRLIEAEATCEGKIARTEKGEQGFGYDPVFEILAATGARPEYLGQTMAQVSPEVKAQVSHRARAVLQMKAILDSSPTL